MRISTDATQAAATGSGDGQIGTGKGPGSSVNTGRCSRTRSQLARAANGPMTAAVPNPAPNEKCADIGGIIGAIKTGCVGETVYKTPKNLTPGTYSYFCRVHPFMRGAFRVVPKKH